MTFLLRLALVIGGLFVGSQLLDYFIAGAKPHFLPRGERIGEWRKAAIREACYPALENPYVDRLGPQRPTEQHRIEWRDLQRTIQLTAALNCYLVTHPDAICEPNNRAYIVDYIGRYFAKSDEMLATAEGYGDREIQIVQNLWNSPRNRAIDHALASDIKSGRLIKSDFGWFGWGAPEALKSQLDAYQGTSDNCPKTFSPLISQNSLVR